MLSRASRRLSELVARAASVRAAMTTDGREAGAPHRRMRPVERLALDLLAHARTHRAAPPPCAVDCGAVVDEVLASLGGVLRERGALVSVEHLPVLRGHEVQIAMLFRDVILNAVAFAAPGDRPRLTIGAARGPGEWRLSVVDGSSDRRGRRVSSFVFTVPDA
jgi:light-regulated signal transduction histidine kinase (bacteriophytochrome)